jgi:ferritin-like metal-binding protein YciE
VKFFSENLDSLRKLHINQLRMLLSTEQQITEALPEMIEKATYPDLKLAFDSQLQETRNQSEPCNKSFNQPMKLGRSNARPWPA